MKKNVAKGNKVETEVIAETAFPFSLFWTSKINSSIVSWLLDQKIIYFLLKAITEYKKCSWILTKVSYCFLHSDTFKSFGFPNSKHVSLYITLGEECALWCIWKYWLRHKDVWYTAHAPFIYFPWQFACIAFGLSKYKLAHTLRVWKVHTLFYNAGNLSSLHIPIRPLYSACQKTEAQQVWSFCNFFPSGSLMGTSCTYKIIILTQMLAGLGPCFENCGVGTMSFSLHQHVLTPDHSPTCPKTKQRQQ